MPRTAAGVRADPAARVADLARQRPEWEAWLRLVATAEREAVDSDLGSVDDHAAAPAAADTPLLHHRTLRIDAARAQRVISDLAMTASELDGATSLRGYRPSANEALQLIGAAVKHQEAEIMTAAAERGIDGGALASLAHLAAMPVLRNAGHSLQSAIPQHWPHGHCPICAAWPIFAERRGLDRSRRLRCGRCAAAWEVQWLTCIYCGERNHERLGFLEPDEQGEMLKVETCVTCKGYLKSISSLQGFPAFELLLQDLETIELDLVALDRGFQRPLKAAFILDLDIADAASGGRL